MAAAKPPRATVVVPLVARPLVAWMTATPASAHSNAAMVPAAPPPTISTLVSWRTIGMSRRSRLLGLIIAVPSGVVASSLGDFDECVHTCVGEGNVVDVQHQFVDARGLHVLLKGICENPVVLGAFPRAPVVALKIVRAALGVLAEAFKRDEHA